MIVDLVRTRTSDDLRLDGALHAPSNPATGVRRAILCLHGVGGNFYASGLFDELGEAWLTAGHHVLRVNTRGHDGFSFAAGISGRQGAAFEIVDGCRHDIEAWLSFLRERSFDSVVLAGHSLGAIKAIYTTALEHHELIEGVVAMSPPRLSHAAFQNGPQSSEFFVDMAAAERAVQDGRPDTLIAARVPFPILIAADCYIDKYGPKERYNILKYIDRLPHPTLFTYGELELEHGGIAFAGLPEAISQRHLPEQLIEVQSIPGANHMYTSVTAALAECISTWMRYNLRSPA